MPTTYVWTGASSGAFATAGNWSPSGPPTTGDTAIFDFNATQSLVGSDQSAITLAALIVYQSFLFAIGTTATALKIGATSVQIGQNLDPAASPAGPTRINLDLHTIASSVIVYNSGLALTDTGLENIRIKGNHTSNSFQLISSTVSVGLATNAVGDVANFPTIQANGGRLNIGSGCSCSSMSLGGNIICNAFSGPGTLTLSGNARLNTYGDYAITLATVSGGTWNASHRKSSGASITTLTRSGGTIDFSADPRALTVTTYNEGAGTLKVSSSSQVTFTTTVQSNSSFLQRQVSLS